MLMAVESTGNWEEAMRKPRNLSDEEIAIVKAMLRKGWRNDFIHFYFNKADRLISSGRITQIKAGKYGPSVEEAQPEDLHAFLSAWDDSKFKTPPAPSPVDLRILRSMFVRETGMWRLVAGETDRTECKANFRLQPEERFSNSLTLTRSRRFALFAGAPAAAGPRPARRRKAGPPVHPDFVSRPFPPHFPQRAG
jgi:hypothetical protein